MCFDFLIIWEPVFLYYILLCLSNTFRQEWERKLLIFRTFLTKRGERTRSQRVLALLCLLKELCAWIKKKLAERNMDWWTESVLNGCVTKENLANNVLEVWSVCGYGFFCLQYYFQFCSYKPKETQLDDDPLVTSITYHLYSVWNIFP